MSDTVRTFTVLLPLAIGAAVSGMGPATAASIAFGATWVDLRNSPLCLFLVAKGISALG
jgi:hypothetical protein